MKMKLHFSTPSEAATVWIDRLFDHQDKPDDCLDVYTPRSRMYASGFTVYSYGHHFPLVRWLPEHRVFLLNSGSHSQTTSRHKSAVGWAVRNFAPRFEAQVFYVDHAYAWFPDSPFASYLAYYDEQIRSYLASARRARAHKSFRIHQAENYLNERNRFVRTFKVDAPELPEDVTAALVTLKLAA